MGIALRTAPPGRHLRVVSRQTLTKLLLAGAAASFLLYVAMDATSALRYPGYNYFDQTISELSAIDAPTRPLWIPLGLLYAVLSLGGGVGIWRAAGRRRTLRLVAGSVFTVGLLGLVAWPLAPMHQRAVLAAGGGTIQDTMHLVLSGADTVLFFAAMTSGAGAFGRRFKVYSWATIALVLIFGAYTGMNGARVSADDPTPWLGVSERIAVFGSMLWIAIASLCLFHQISADDQLEDSTGVSGARIRDQG